MPSMPLEADKPELCDRALYDWIVRDPNGAGVRIERLRTALGVLIAHRDSAGRGEHYFGENSPWNEELARDWQAARDALRF